MMGDSVLRSVSAVTHKLDIFDGLIIQMLEH